MHLREFEFAFRTGIDGGSHAVRRDELDAYALGGVSTGDPHHSSGASREAALNRPFLRLGAIPGVRRWIFAFHAAFSRMKISAQIRYVRLGKTGAKCGHSGTTLFDFGRDVVVIDGITGRQVLTLKEVLQQGGAFGVLVVAHPTFIEVNVFAARRAAIGENLVGIQAEGPLEIVRGDVRRGRSLRGFGRRLSHAQAGRRACDRQSRQGEKGYDCAWATMIGGLCWHIHLIRNVGFFTGERNIRPLASGVNSNQFGDA